MSICQVCHFISPLSYFVTGGHFSHPRFLELWTTLGKFIVFERLYLLHVLALLYVLPATSLTPQDPRWLGAWWLGFIVFGGVSVVPAVPLFFFPKRIKGRHIVLSDDDKTQSFCDKVKGSVSEFMM